MTHPFRRSPWFFTLGIAFLLLALPLSLVGCKSQRAAEKVATVNGTVVTRGEYDKVFNQFSRMFRVSENAETLKNPMVQETIKRMTVNKLILNTLLKNAAEKEGIQVTDADVKTFKDQQFGEKPGQQSLKDILAQTQMSEAELDDSIREQLLINRFLEKMAGPQLAVTDQEAQGYYKTHAKQFDVPASVEVRHILVKAVEPELKKAIREKNPNITPEDLEKKVAEEKATRKAKAEKLLAEVKAEPAKLGELAQKNSDDTISAKNNGKVGPLNEQNTEPTFWKAVMTTTPGTLHAGVVETPFGYHIVWVDERTQPHHQDFAEAKPLIKNALQYQKKQRALETWLKDQQGSAQIAIEPPYQPAQMQGEGGSPQAGAAPMAKSGQAAQ